MAACSRMRTRTRTRTRTTSAAVPDDRPCPRPCHHRPCRRVRPASAAVGDDATRTTRACCGRCRRPRGLAGRAGPVARPFARHKQSTGLFVSRLSLPHRLRPARRTEGVHGARHDTARHRVHPDAVCRRTRFQRARRSSLRRRREATCNQQPDCVPASRVAVTGCAWHGWTPMVECESQGGCPQQNLPSVRAARPTRLNVPSAPLKIPRRATKPDGSALEPVPPTERRWRLKNLFSA